MIKRIRTNHHLQQIVPAASAKFTDKLAGITNLAQSISPERQRQKGNWLSTLIPIEYIAFASLLFCVLTLSVVMITDQSSLFDESIYAMHELYLDDLYTDHAQLLFAANVS